MMPASAGETAEPAGAACSEASVTAVGPLIVALTGPCISVAPDVLTTCERLIGIDLVL